MKFEGMHQAVEGDPEHDPWEMYDPGTKRRVEGVSSLRRHALNEKTVSVEGILDAQDAEVRVRGPGGRMIWWEVPERASLSEIALFDLFLKETHAAGKLTVTL